MPAPSLNLTLSLESIREDISFLHISLTTDELAKSFAKPVAALLTEWSTVHAQQLSFWDAQTRAQVAVYRADVALDARVDVFDNDLRRVVNNDRSDARYRLFFAVAPSELKRPVLGEQLATLRQWDTLLAAETNASLKAHRKPLAKEIAAADEALRARETADAANSAFRNTGGLAQYLERVVGVRDRVWAELEGVRAKQPVGALPRDWADSFFKPRAASAITEAERKARAEEREAARRERDELARKRKELADKLKETQRELKALSKGKGKKK